jgi:CheY-like chemotaxis protein
MQSTPPSHAAPAPGPSQAAAAGGRVLVVDDNADAVETLAELLQLLGYETRTAGDADSAMRQIDDFRPQLALFDIGLPGADGYELARRVRARPDGSAIRLVALTGYGQESDRARAMEAKFDEHLVKPVAIDDLTSVITRLLG